MQDNKIRKVVFWAHSMKACALIRSKCTGQTQFSQSASVVGVVAQRDHSSGQPC